MVRWITPPEKSRSWYVFYVKLSIGLRREKKRGEKRSFGYLRTRDLERNKW